MPSSSTRSPSTGRFARSSGTAAATPGAPATSSRSDCANPASVTPETSRSALPASPVVSRCIEPVTDPDMANTATRKAADTATTATVASVRPQCTANSRTVNSRSRSNGALTAAPASASNPP